VLSFGGSCTIGGLVPNIFSKSASPSVGSTGAVFEDGLDARRENVSTEPENIGSSGPVDKAGCYLRTTSYASGDHCKLIRLDVVKTCSPDAYRSNAGP